MRQYTFRSAMLAGLGSALLLAGAGVAGAAETPPPAGPQCAAGGGVPVQASFGPFGAGSACFGGEHTGFELQGQYEKAPMPAPPSA